MSATQISVNASTVLVQIQIEQFHGTSFQSIKYVNIASRGSQRAKHRRWYKLIQFQYILMRLVAKNGEPRGVSSKTILPRRNPRRTVSKAKKTCIHHAPRFP